MHLAKIVFEHQTITYAITKLSAQLGISPEQLETATADARSKHPFRGLRNRTSTFNVDEDEEADSESFVDSVSEKGSSIRHCHNLEKILYLQKIARERAGTLPNSPGSAPVSISDEDDDDDSGFDEAYDELHSEDADDDCEIGAASTPPAGEKSDEMSVLLSDLAALVYMGHVEALFHNFILSRREKLTIENINTYEEHAKSLLQYFGDGKVAQLRRKNQKDPMWEKSFMSHQTYKNLRKCVSGFFHFSRYMLAQVFPTMEGLTFIPMLCSNQSSLEGKFSSQRRTGHDKGSSFSSGLSGKSNKQAIGAMGVSGYSADDCIAVAHDNGAQILGSALFKRHFETAKSKLSELKEMRQQPTVDNVTSTRFGLEHLDRDEAEDDESEQERIMLDCKYEDSKEMASNLINGKPDSNYIDSILNSVSFEECVKLCHDRDDMKGWFEAFIACGDADFDKACQQLMRRLFRFWENASFGNTTCDSFEQSILKYSLSSDFEEFYTVDLPQSLNGHRLGALYLVDALRCVFESWIYDALSIITESRTSKREALLTIESPGMVSQMQRMVGAAVAKAFAKFCPSKRKDDTLFRLLSCIAIKHDDAIQNKEYLDIWYPDVLRNENMGKLHLIDPKFVEWASKLMVFSVNFFRKENLIRYRRNAIKVGMEQLHKNESLSNAFKESVLKDSGLRKSGVTNTLLEKLHTYLSAFAFHAYSGFRWKLEFNSIQNSVTDKTNLAIRQLIQTTGSADGSSSKSSSGPPKKKQRVTKVSTASMLTGRTDKASSASTSNGASNSSVTSSNASNSTTTDATVRRSSTTSRKRRTSEQDFKEDYLQCIRNALIKLTVDSNNDVKALDKRECCAVLCLYFKTTPLVKDTKIKVSDARKMIEDAIDGDVHFSVTAAGYLSQLEDADPGTQMVVASETEEDNISHAQEANKRLGVQSNTPGMPCNIASKRPVGEQHQPTSQSTIVPNRRMVVNPYANHGQKKRPCPDTIGGSTNTSSSP